VRANVHHVEKIRECRPKEVVKMRGIRPETKTKNRESRLY